MLLVRKTPRGKPNTRIEGEEWDWVDKVNFPNYMISNFSRLWNIVTDVKTYGCLSKGRWVAILSNEGKASEKQMQKLVADHFLPNPDGKTVSYRIDITRRPFVENLTWDKPSPKEFNPKGRPIYQLDKDTGKVLKRWEKIQEVVADGYSRGHVTESLSNGGLYRGYYWVHCDIHDFDKLYGHLEWREVEIPVGEEGDIVKLSVSENGMIQRETGRTTMGTDRGDGYLDVELTNEKSENATWLVHRLVAKAFLEGDDSLGINHEDGNKKNNNYRNLTYMTTAQNNQHAIETGLHTFKYKKPVIQYTLAGIEVRRFQGPAEAAKILNLDKSSITKACKGKIRTAGGFVWHYA